MRSVRRPPVVLVFVVLASLAQLARPSARAASGVPSPVPARQLAGAPAVLYVPASAHAGGANGADWRTDLQIHNAGAEPTTATIELLVRDAENSSPESRTMNLAAGASLRLRDVLLETFGFTGAAALRITSPSSRIVVTSRTYNLVGPGASGLPQGASFGQFVRGVPEEKAIPYGREGRLIQLTQRDASSGLDFRTNVGFVNVGTSTIELRLDLYRADGTWLGARSGDETRLRAREFRQISEVFKPFGTVTDGYAIARTTTPGGRFFAFATVIDNHLSGDPIFVPALETASSAVPTPSPTPPAPTPTPTAPASRPNLILYRPSGWPACLVGHSSAGCCSTTACCASFLTAGSSAHFQFVVANSGTATHTGAVRFGLWVDGALTAYANWTNASGLPSGQGTLLTWEYAGAIAAGAHDLRLSVDPENVIAESNEGDNDCATRATWNGPVILSQPDPAAFETELPEGRPVPLETPETPRFAASGEEVWIPAAAHASGMNGASWRTDLEVHNPGTTAATYSIQLLPRDRDNASPAAQASFSLDPQKGVRYVDVLESVFGFTGAAALRIVPTTGSILATSRTYNLVGVNGVGLPVGASFGQFVPGLPESEAISSSEEGRLIQLTQREAASGAEFRTNVGIVNTTGVTVDVRLDFYRADGTLLGTKDGDATRLPPRGFRQLSEAFADWGVVADGYVVARPVTPGGRIFAFATVIDNHVSGDPICVMAERMSASAGGTPPPTPTPGTGVITGPGGSTVVLPPGATSSGASITLVAGDGATLPKAGETLVSGVVKTNVSGTGVAIGNGTFTVTIPVTGVVPDPQKVLLKVAVSTGPVYPVAGVYDAAKRTFTAELMKVWNGWTMGVVTSTGLKVASTGPLVPRGGISTQGWVTPMDWQTCEFSAYDHAPSGSGTFKAGYLSAIRKACEHLRGAEFRSPQLWVDGRWNPKTRAIHFVQGTGKSDPRTSFVQTGDQQDAAFSIIGLTDAQMEALGQIYFNWDQWNDSIQVRGWSFENVAIHELLHAVQYGYDFRDNWWKVDDRWWHTAMAFTEGTATLVGQMFQSNLNGIYGGDVTVRSPEPPAKLDEELLWYCCVNAYSRQDFFAYVAKRWSGGSLRDLRWLFQHLSDQTDGRFGLPNLEYDVLYRKAMDFHYRSAYSLPLPELYAEYVLDRAYRHDPAAVLRAADALLPKRSLDTTLFSSLPTYDAAIGNPVVLPNIAPLEARAVKVTVPASSRSAGRLDVPIAVGGATLGMQGLRIFFWAEKDGVGQTAAPIELTDISRPAVVPVGPETTTLTILVVNGSVEDDVATVTIGGGFPRVSLGNTAYSFNCIAAACEGKSCPLNLIGNEWGGPLTWNGTRFSLVGSDGGWMDGELSADRRTLLRFRWGAQGMILMEWTNLPLDAARTTSTQTVYAVSGPAAAPHIVTAHNFLCSKDYYSGIDYSLPVQIELLFGP